MYAATVVGSIVAAVVVSVTIGIVGSGAQLLFVVFDVVVVVFFCILIETLMLLITIST